MKAPLSKLLLVLLLLAAAYAFFRLGLADAMNLAALKTKSASLQQEYSESPGRFLLAFFGIYVLTTALSLPGATILTLAGGALLGLGRGVLVVSFASTVGATLAFLASRFLLRDFVQRKGGSRLEKLNQGFAREGAFYLFTLRLVPAFPFFLVNLLMGLTPIRVVPFFWVSQLGMLPATVVYVNAGTQLSQLHSVREILSPGLLISFAAIGLLPWASRWLLRLYRPGNSPRKFAQPAAYDYNLIVIGAGSAGLVSSYIAAAVKAKVALIEKHRMGGDCLNTGCVPSKALIRSAKVAHDLRRAADFGLTGASVEVDFAKVMDRVKGVIAQVAPHDSVERYRGLGVDCIEGAAQIVSPYEVEVNGRRLTTKSIIVATGARPMVPPIPGLERIAYLTSDTVWELRRLPRRLLVLGGGPIGCELAQAFRRLGSEVTQVEMGPRLMGREDADVAAMVETRFRSEGIRVLTSHQAQSFHAEGDRKWLRCARDGNPVDVEFDEVLLALGRRANAQGLGLEELGIEVSPQGTLEHDELLRTRYPNIYVCGDVAGPYQFTHTAAHQAWYAAVNALFSPLKSFRADYRVIPWATFTDPEVARVGLNEREAKEKNIPVEVTTYHLSDLDRAIADGEDHGFVKVLTRPGKDEVLGATIVGYHASELITEYVSAMKHRLGLNHILSTIHIYPTLSEANKYAAGQWKREHAPKLVLRWIERFHRIRRGKRALP